MFALMLRWKELTRRNTSAALGGRCDPVIRNTQTTSTHIRGASTKAKPPQSSRYRFFDPGICRHPDAKKIIRVVRSCQAASSFRIAGLARPLRSFSSPSRWTRTSTCRF